MYWLFFCKSKTFNAHCRFEMARKGNPPGPGFFSVVLTLLFYQIKPLKNGVSLILPSIIARNSMAPNAKIIFEIL